MDVADIFCPVLLMQITRATDYAVRVMVHLASAPHGQKYPLNELAIATGVQQSFLSKILQRLVHQGMLLSQRGSGGGFVLNRAPDQITLFDVVQSIAASLFGWGATLDSFCLVVFLSVSNRKHPE